MELDLRVNPSESIFHRGKSLHARKKIMSVSKISYRHTDTCISRNIVIWSFIIYILLFLNFTTLEIMLLKLKYLCANYQNKPIQREKKKKIATYYHKDQVEGAKNKRFDHCITKH